ncbi:hypothetical protein HK405_014419, partial [Cladochytrium tenue]
MAAPLLRPSIVHAPAATFGVAVAWPGRFSWSSLARHFDTMRSLAAIPKVVRLVLNMNTDDLVMLVTAEIDRVVGRLD